MALIFQSNVDGVLSIYYYLGFCLICWSGGLFAFSIYPLCPVEYSFTGTKRETNFVKRDDMAHSIQVRIHTQNRLCGISMIAPQRIRFGETV